MKEIIIDGFYFHDSVIDKILIKGKNLHINLSYLTSESGEQFSADVDIIEILEFKQNGIITQLHNQELPELNFHFDGGQIYDLTGSRNTYKLEIYWENNSTKEQKYTAYEFTCAGIYLKNLSVIKNNQTVQRW